MPKTPLAPIMHQTLKDHHRVPVAVVDGKYELYIQDNYVRIFDEEELPDVIKARITMIKANSREPPPSDVTAVMRAYEHPLDSNMLEIGWQPCQGLYVVVIPTKDLTYIRKSTYPMGARKYLGFVIMNDKPTFDSLEGFVSNRVVISTVGRFNSGGNT